MVRYLYGTTLRTDAEAWHGLELEYAALEMMITRTVLIRFVLRESRISTVPKKNFMVPYEKRVT